MHGTVFVHNQSEPVCCKQRPNYTVCLGQLGFLSLAGHEISSNLPSVIYKMKAWYGWGGGM